MLVCLVSFATAGSEQVLNDTVINGLFDDSVIEDGKWINGTWNGVWWSNPCTYAKDEFLTKDTICSDVFQWMYYTRYFEDKVVKTTKKTDGSACITEWVCESGDWVKEDWMHPKRVEECITNYNEENCAVATRTWNRIIPGEYCVVLNDNGIGAKPKPTTSCEVVQQDTEQTSEVEKQTEQPIIVPEKKKGFWAWFKGLFN